MAYPVFQHFGVDLWVPEVGGAIDPESEAHDLVMSVFAGMSKGERTRIKIRVRSAMASQERIEGRFLGGRPPYGYRLADAGPHPNPAKAAAGQRLHRLELNPATGPVVQRIYAEYLHGYGIFAIAQRLTAEGIPSPAAADPARNSHRCGVAWSKGALRTILINRRYTGRQVWNKQRKQETLIDVEDVGLGHAIKLAWNPQSSWVVSEGIVHPPLVSDEVFQQVQLRLAARGRSTPRESGTRGRHPYALRGIIRCAVCGRKMQGAWNHDRPQYRCRFPGEYAVANKIDHPLAVYVLEEAIISPLDAWLPTTLAPASLRAALAQTEHPEPSIDPAVDAACRQLAECDRKLARHRAALEAGADPLLVAQWTNEVRRIRQAARATLDADRPVEDARRLNPDEVTALIESLGGLLSVLRQAAPNDKCDLYRRLGVSINYAHATRTLRM
jgi:hypothetical protein